MRYETLFAKPSSVATVNTRIAHSICSKETLLVEMCASQWE